MKKAILASLLLVVSVTFTGCGGEMAAEHHTEQGQQTEHSHH